MKAEFVVLYWMFFTAQMKPFQDDNQYIDDQLSHIKEQLNEYETYLRDIQQNFPANLNSTLIHLKQGITLNAKKNVSNISANKNIEVADSFPDLDSFAAKLKEQIRNKTTETLNSTEVPKENTSHEAIQQESNTITFNNLKTELSDNIQNSKTTISQLEASISKIYVNMKAERLNKSPFLVQIQHDISQQANQLNQINQTISQMPAQISQRRSLFNRFSPFVNISSSKASGGEHKLNLEKLYEIPDCSSSFLQLVSKSYEAIDKFRGDLQMINAKISSFDTEISTSAEKLENLNSTQESIDLMIRNFEDQAMDAMDKVETLESKISPIETVSSLKQIHGDVRIDLTDFQTQIRNIKEQLEEIETKACDSSLYTVNE